jgi:hypothetical protein
LMGSKFGLERHFFLKRNFNKWPRICKIKSSIRGGIVELKWQRFGNVQHHNNAISREDLQKILLSYNPAVPDPKSLQQFVWFNIIYVSSNSLRKGKPSTSH